MASAQILQLYYTKDNKNQQGNQSKYHHQRSKPLLQGRQSITIPRKQFPTLPQNNNTFSKLTERFYSFHSTSSDNYNNNYKKNKNNPNSSINNKSKSKSKSKSKESTTDSWHQLQHHTSLFTNNIEKCVPRTKTTSQQPPPPPPPLPPAAFENDSNKDDEDIEEKDTTTKDHIPTATEKTCLWWKDIFNFPKNESRSPKDDATPAAIGADALDDCEAVPPVAFPGATVHHYDGCPSGTVVSGKSSDATGAPTTKATSSAPSQQHHNHNGKENNHFQYNMCSPLPSQLPPPSPTPSQSSLSSSSPSQFSNDDIGNSNNEFAAKQTSSIPQRIDTFITGSYKQCRGDMSRTTQGDMATLWPVAAAGIDPGCNGQSATTVCVNFIAATQEQGETNYATPKKTTTTTTTTTETTTATTTTRKTKNFATCCQNNATSNTSVAVAAGVDETCFLQKRIDFYRNDSLDKTNAGYCLLCKFKPNTCQKSKSPACCEQCCRKPSATLVRYDKQNSRYDTNAKRLQSSNIKTSTRDSSSSLLLQSTTSGSKTTTTTRTTTTTLSRLSSKQECCCNEEQSCTPKTGQFETIHHHHHHHQQQQQYIRQQRTTKIYNNFDCQKCDNRKWPLCNTTNNNNNNNTNNSNNIEFNHKVNTNNITSKSRLFTTPTTSVDANRKFCRKLSENAISAFTDVQKFTRAILPLIIIFNILPLLYAVASNSDATELKGGPNPDPYPWIPVVAYLEPLPRPTKSPKCDQTFVSRVGGPQNGTFSAPLIHNPRNHSRQCLYIFLAGPGQRVEVVFTTFNLRGSPPDGSAVGELPTCVHEYMDIYSEVQSSDPADLINSPFGGRFCGTIPPRRRISMHRAIAISFFTNKNVSEPDLFEGHYRFLNASEYEIGIPIAGSPCSYTITPSMSINKTGALISPTYPGAYPKDMSCTYQFLGETNQRVRLEFRDFDLFFGGPHCPFDYVKVYDGPDNSSALIGTYCGQQRNLVLYSSESSLFVHFYTLPRTANTQNRGFKGIYEFSESFVKLDFIRENDGIHIRGSECDQKILSKKESTGFVLSPNYPYPYIPKTVCRYFIYGMQDAQHLERVRLEFSAFNIPKVEHKDKGETNCSDGYLKIYLKGQETADAYDKFDYELCGNETQRVVSDGPRLAMVFSSGELQGRGFKGKYTFETEYKIPGTAAPDGTCSFTYVSSSKKRGELNSPRYPSNYPSETNCSYLFLAEPNEQVTIVFDHFKVKADNVNSTAGAYGASACFEDWLEMYVIYRDNNDRFLGRYCGLTAPGPVESPRGAVGLRITLHTDQENVASGFKARYYFETAKSEVGDCGGNFSNEDSGIITSPHYPSNYKSPAKGLASMACNWYMTARPGYKLSINFEHFSVEGDPSARGCPAAVLRMWTNVDSEAAPIELCGEKPPTEHWHYITTGQSARISFTTTDKTIGAQGFRIVWTEIQDSGPGPPAIGLLCESTYHFQCHVGYCISDKLRCDGVKNCGPGDDSDEMHCITEAPKEDHGVLIIISMAAVSFLICLLCTLCHRQKKRRHRQLGLHRNTGHYDSTTSATGLSSSRRHLQGGGSLSGSLHGINSGTLIIPPAPLPPTSVPPPPHICIAGTGAGGGLGMGGIGSGMMIGAGLDDDDDNDDDEDNPDIFINDIRFDENNLDQLETV